MNIINDILNEMKLLIDKMEDNKPCYKNKDVIYTFIVPTDISEETINAILSFENTKVIKNSSMLPCGENIYVVPEFKPTEIRVKFINGNKNYNVSSYKECMIPSYERLSDRRINK